MQPDLEAWDAWPPEYLRERMAGVCVPWGVAGGWALDLFRGSQSRPHEDLEIAIPAADFDQIPLLFPDCDFAVPRDGLLHPATSDMLAAEHQTWARERSSGKWRFDVFREPHDGGTWICRRDPSIRRPYAEVFAETAGGIPYVRPEIVLLFKAKGLRDKDEADFAATLPLLDESQRRWLCDALALVHPGHRWLLAAEPSSRTDQGDGRDLPACRRPYR
jgi:hypothetical protein